MIIRTRKIERQAVPVLARGIASAGEHEPSVSASEAVPRDRSRAPAGVVCAQVRGSGYVVGVRRRRRGTAGRRLAVETASFLPGRVDA